MLVFTCDILRLRSNKKADYKKTVECIGEITYNKSMDFIKPELSKKTANGAYTWQDVVNEDADTSMSEGSGKSSQRKKKKKPLETESDQKSDRLSQDFVDIELSSTPRKRKKTSSHSEEDKTQKFGSVTDSLIGTKASQNPRISFLENQSFQSNPETNVWETQNMLTDLEQDYSPTKKERNELRNHLHSSIDLEEDNIEFKKEKLSDKSFTESDRAHSPHCSQFNKKKKKKSLQSYNEACMSTDYSIDNCLSQDLKEEILSDKSFTDGDKNQSLESFKGKKKHKKKKYQKIDTIEKVDFLSEYCKTIGDSYGTNDFNCEEPWKDEKKDIFSPEEFENRVLTDQYFTDNDQNQMLDSSQVKKKKKKKHHEEVAKVECINENLKMISDSGDINNSEESVKHKKKKKTKHVEQTAESQEFKKEISKDCAKHQPEPSSVNQSDTVSKPKKKKSKKKKDEEIEEESIPNFDENDRREKKKHKHKSEGRDHLKYQNNGSDYEDSGVNPNDQNDVKFKKKKHKHKAEQKENKHKEKKVKSASKLDDLILKNSHNKDTNAHNGTVNQLKRLFSEHSFEARHKDNSSSNLDLSLDEMVKEIKDKSYLSVEDTEKLNNLNVMLTHSVPPLHLIETRISQVPTPTQRAEIEALGVSIKTGIFSRAEDEQIKKNWKSFCKLHDLSTDPRPFFSLATPDRRFILPTEERLKFVRYLAKGLQDRMLCSVYKRFKRIFLNTDISIGRFTQSETKIIKKFLKTTTSRTPYSDLGKLLNRDKGSIERHCLMLSKQINGKSETFKWTRDNIEAFTSHFVDVLKVDNVSDLKDRVVTSEEWKEMEKRLNVPAEKLRRGWICTVYPRFFVNQRRSDEVRRRLLAVLTERRETDWRTVNWDSVAKALGEEFEGFTGRKLLKIFKHMASYHVNSKMRGHLGECLTVLNSLSSYKLKGKPIKKLKIVDNRPEKQ